MGAKLEVLTEMPKATDKQGKNTERVGKGSPPVSAQWKPGQSGNPKGRPKSITLSEAYRRELARPDPDDEHGRTFAEVIAARMIVRAKDGDVQAMREMADRTEGKPKQTVTLSMEKRDQLEQAIQGIIAEAEAAGAQCTREEAISTLALFRPEASNLIN